MLKKIGILAAVLLVATAVLMLTARSSRFAVANAAEIAHSPTAVWSVLTTVAEWSAWWPGVSAARLAPGWQEGAVLAIVLEGNPERSPAWIVTFDPPREMGWRRDGVLGSTTRTLWRLEPVPGGTIVHLESSIEGPQAILARITGRGAFETYQQAVLAGLERRLQPPSPAPSDGVKPL